jgi:predicted ATPase/DNA-binding SARP family transcriptional activator
VNRNTRSAFLLSKELEDQPPPRLRCCLLGGFHLQRGEKCLVADQIRLSKARDLLKLLALAPNHRLHREHLLEMLWPERPPQAAAHSLSQTLYTLRPRLVELDPSTRLGFDDECLVLSVDGGFSTDVEDFEQVARSALGHIDPLDSKAAACFQEAIVAYAGDLLPEDGPSDLFYQRRDQLRQLYLHLLLQLANYHLETRAYFPAIDCLQKVIAADPANEEAHLCIMQAYAMNGQRQAALRQYQLLEEALRRELEVEPAPESQRLRARILSGKLTSSRLRQDWLGLPRHNLPAMLSSFIGREGEAAEVQCLVLTNRLVTLTGAGGVGKTRLALKATEALLGQFPQGVYWVDLAALSNPSLVAKAALDVFRLNGQNSRGETERLVDFLKNRSLVLLLDNCEHLLAGCACLAETLLKTCPGLHILATSQMRLNLPGEFTYLVPSLPAPDPTHPISLTDMAQYDAVRLFSERAGSHSRGFRLTAANTPAVAHICRRLDGIPLALELAAARIRMMTPEQIAAQLNDAFRLLVGGSRTALPRHRTLRASIDWSYNLLSGQERLLLQRLSVFAGGWDLEAAEAVCAGEVIRQCEIMDLLWCLVDHSLVVTETVPAGAARYHLLETVRWYAHERLGESGEAALLCQRHLAYYLKLAEQADLGIRGPQQLIWLKWFERDRNNLISALENSLSSPISVEMGIHLVCDLDWCWRLVGDFILEKNYLRRALSLSASCGRTRTRARALFHVGFSYPWCGMGLLSPPEAKACLEGSLEIWREMGQDTLQEQAKCLLALGYVQQKYLKDDRGLKLILESLETFQISGNTWWQAWALNYLSALREELAGDAQAARAILQQDMILWQKAGDRWGEAISLMAWGQYALRQGDFVEARDFLQNCLEIYQEFGSKGGIFQASRDLGHASRALQEYDQAEAYYDQCLSFAEEIGWKYLLPHYGIGFVAFHQGDDQRAGMFFDLTLRMALELGVRHWVILSLTGYAALCLRREKPVEAARLFGAFSTLAGADQIQVDPVYQIEIDHYLNLCRGQLEKGAFDQAWNAGRQMTLGTALACAQGSSG